MMPKELTDEDIAYISQNVCCPYYRGNLEATRLVVKVIANLVCENHLKAPSDYIKAYDDILFTFKTWEELVASEADEGEFALSESELKVMLGSTIFRLENGWYVECV